MAKRKPLVRDLTKAKALRPRDIFNLYGVHPSMTCRACKSTDPEFFLPSVMIEGRKGRQGARYIELGDFETWWAKRKKSCLVAGSVASAPSLAA
jgi:hypothetical protein